MVEHAGTVRAVHDGIAEIAVETGGCSSCGHAAGCGVGKMAAGRPATVVSVPAGDLVHGTQVSLRINEHSLVFAALLGYLFPAVTMLIGAGIGANLGSDATTALGGIGGLAFGLLLTRLLPGWTPRPQVITLPDPIISTREIKHVQ
jgi:sigma-E factor negative regulatory protein RseC